VLVCESASWLTTPRTWYFVLLEPLPLAGASGERWVRGPVVVLPCTAPTVSGSSAARAMPGKRKAASIGTVMIGNMRR